MNGTTKEQADRTVLEVDVFCSNAAHGDPDAVQARNREGTAEGLGREMRNISFALTTEQVRTRTKTVTRRLGWKDLKPGTLLQPVEKAQGLKKGEKLQKISGPIRVVNVSRAPLRSISAQDIHGEGFPQMTYREFVTMFKRSHPGCRVDTVVTRIQFEYVDEAPA